MDGTPRYSAGEQVRYWGYARSGKLYGASVSIVYANVCGCKHQTYAVDYSDPDTGQTKRLEQVMEDNLKPMEDAE